MTEQDWKKPFKELFDSLDFEKLPKPPYEWLPRDKNLQTELNKFIVDELTGDVAEDILSMRIPQEEHKSVFQLLDKAMGQLYLDPNSAKALLETPIGSFSIIPIAAFWDGSRLIWYRMGSISQRSYREYLRETVRITNQYLTDTQKPPIPEYPYA